MDLQSDDLEEPLVEEVLVLEEDEPTDAFSSADEAPASPSDSPSESPRTRRGAELYYEDQIATMELRFAVGERVECSVDKGNAEGVVVKRHHEEEWPKGYYAAYQVRSTTLWSRMRPSSTRRAISIATSASCGAHDAREHDHSCGSQDEPTTAAASRARGQLAHAVDQPDRRRREEADALRPATEPA